MRHIKPQKELSTGHKVWKSEHFHQHGKLSREAIVFTNDSNPTNDDFSRGKSRHPMRHSGPFFVIRLSFTSRKKK